MTHPGVGPLTALAYELIIGTAERFPCGKQLASYMGLVPTEESSGDRRQLGHITKQGNVLLRFLLVEAAQVTVRSQPEWRNKYFHLAMRRGRKIAKVAMARRIRRSYVLDVASGMGLRPDEEARFARGTARTSRWCAANHRVMIGHPAPCKGEFELAILIAVVIEEMAGSDRVLTRTIRSEPRLENANHQRERNGALSESTDQYAQKVLDSADIVRDAMLRQQSPASR